MRISASEWTRHLKDQATAAATKYQKHAGFVQDIQHRLQSALGEVKDAHRELADLWHVMGDGVPLGRDVQQRLLVVQEERERAETEQRQRLVSIQSSCIKADEEYQQAKEQLARLTHSRVAWEEGLRQSLSTDKDWVEHQSRLAETLLQQKDALSRATAAEEESSRRHAEFFSNEIWSYLAAQQASPSNSPWVARMDRIVSEWSRYASNRALLDEVAARAEAWESQAEQIDARLSEQEAHTLTLLQRAAGAEWSNWAKGMEDATIKAQNADNIQAEWRAKQQAQETLVKSYDLHTDPQALTIRRILDDAIQGLNLRTAQHIAAKTPIAEDDLVVQQWRDAHQEWSTLGTQLDEAKKELDELHRQQEFWQARVRENRAQGNEGSDYQFAQDVGTMLAWLAQHQDPWPMIRQARRTRPRQSSPPSMSSSLPSLGGFGGGFKTGGGFGGGGSRFRTGGGF